MIDHFDLHKQGSLIQILICVFFTILFFFQYNDKITILTNHDKTDQS